MANNELRIKAAKILGIGAAALSGSILSDDLLRYYHNRQLLAAAEKTLTRLASLNADYDALLGRLQKDPNLFKRIATATLGTEPENKDAVYPKATPEQLDAARKALGKKAEQQPPEPMVPEWLARCSQPRQRIILFLAGAFLVLVSFIWFGPMREKNQEEAKK